MLCDAEAVRLGRWILETEGVEKSQQLVEPRHQTELHSAVAKVAARKSSEFVDKKKKKIKQERDLQTGCKELPPPQNLIKHPSK